MPSSNEVLTRIADESKKAKATKKQGKELQVKFHHRELSADTFNAVLTSHHPVARRLLDFFSNYFSVTATGRLMKALAPTLEREALIPNLSGHFEDMLLAAEKQHRGL